MKKISYSLSPFAIDYKKQKIAIKVGIIYNKNGEVIFNITYENSQLKWNLIVPNSNAKLWTELIKKLSKFNKIYKYQQSENNS